MYIISIPDDYASIFMSRDNFVSDLVVVHVRYLVEQFVDSLLRHLHVIFISAYLGNESPVLNVNHIYNHVVSYHCLLLIRSEHPVAGGRQVLSLVIGDASLWVLKIRRQLVGQQLLFLDDSEQEPARRRQTNYVVAVVNFPPICFLRVQQSISEVGEHCPVRRPDRDVSISQTHEQFLLVDEYECVRGFEGGDQFGLVGQDVVDLQRLVLLFDQNVLVELFHEFNLLQLALVRDVHQRLSGVHVHDCHWDTVADRVEQQQHHSVADLELGQELMVQHV